MKITFMGAGSTVFAKNVLGDVMCTPALRECKIALYDIDGERLEESYVMVDSLNRNINESRASVEKYLGVEQRKDALRGADFVVNAIQVFRSGCMSPAPSSILKSRKNMVCGRPLPIQTVSAVFSEHYAPFRCWKISVGICRKFVPTRTF